MYIEFFTNQPNLIVDSGVYHLLHWNCHYQIIYGQILLKIEFPPPYQQQVWNYNKTDVTSITEIINDFNWEKNFLNENVNDKVKNFTEIVLNIFSNYIPNKIVTFDDRDPLMKSKEILMKSKG